MQWERAERNPARDFDILLKLVEWFIILLRLSNRTKYIETFAP